MRNKKVLPARISVDSVLPTHCELDKVLEGIAEGLEFRYSSILPYHATPPPHGEYFEEVTVSEVKNVLSQRHNSAPGPDGITTAIIKTLFKISLRALLIMVNYSIKDLWIPPKWRLAKEIPLLRN